jgi:hypothetical protein
MLLRDLFYSVFYLLVKYTNLIDFTTRGSNTLCLDLLLEIFLLKITKKSKLDIKNLHSYFNVWQKNTCKIKIK